MTWLAIIGGLVVLTLGAEWLVRGASRLAALAGVSPLVIGLTVVAYGTSAPELAVSVKSALAGQPDVALGNVVGSNIFNVLFILGLCALILPLRVNSQLVRVDVPMMIVVSVVAYVLCRDGVVSPIDGVILILGGIGYTVYTVVTSRKESKEIQEEFQHLVPAKPATGGSGALRALVLVVLGLAALVIGSRFFVDGAIALARTFGVSELVIGLTIVAAGTSMPEVATSVIAAVRGERDIAVGNVVGSNIFNILIVLGSTSVIETVAVAPSAITLDIPVMVGVAVACLPIFFTGLEIRRWEGALFVFNYAAYTLYLVLHATDHEFLPTYREVMLFVMPITAVTLAILAAHEWRRRSRLAHGH